ncbi:MAG: ADOP family duplicated permease [Deltaproteobacteria bacterium]|nr:ADOP family duplicated permease [Deltaproteobacteria bacterium]
MKGPHLPGRIGPLGLRTWFRRWPLAALAMLTLTLAVAAATILYSVVRIALLDPLPHPRPQDLVVVWETNLEMGLPRFSVAPPNFVDWRERANSFQHLAAFEGKTVNLAGSDGPRQLTARAVLGEYFALLGLPAVAGQLLGGGHTGPGSPPVVVLSESLWKSQFGARPSLIGDTIVLDGLAHTVLGIARDEVRGEADLWVPYLQEAATLPRDSHYLRVLGRLKPGVGVAAAQQEMAGIAAALEVEYPATNGGWQVLLQPLREATVGDLRGTLLLLQGAVLALLLIACTNLMSLLLARSASRSQEMALRLAFGASRLRIFAEHLSEVAWLAAPGGLLGLLLAAVGTPLLVSLYAGALPRRSEITVDASVVAFALGVTLIITVFSTWIPALVNSHQGLASLVRGGISSKASRRRPGRLRSLLVMIQLGLALAVVTAASLLASNLLKLSRVDPGFQPDRAWTLSLNLSDTEGGPEAQAERWRRLLERRGILARAEALGAIFPMPLAQPSYLLTFLQPGQEHLSPQEQPIASFRWVSEDGFAAMGTPVRQGRTFTAPEANSSVSRVALVNEKTAAQLWPGESALGKNLLLEFDASGRFSYRVIGVTGNIHNRSLEADPGPEIYLPLASNPESFGTLLLRTSREEEGTAQSWRQELRKIDAALPTFGIRPLRQVVDDALGDSRFLAWLVSLFAVIALLLAAIGVFGVITQVARLRRREFGIRLALGEQPRDLMTKVLRHSLLLATGGVLVGLAAFFASRRALAAALFDLDHAEPRALVVSSLLLFAVALLAGLGPALEAKATDPAGTLRSE